MYTEDLAWEAIHATKDGKVCIQAAGKGLGPHRAYLWKYAVDKGFHPADGKCPPKFDVNKMTHQNKAKDVTLSVWIV
jgi:hypothetical protein